jgi:hypothetical protein
MPFPGRYRPEPRVGHDAARLNDFRNDTLFSQCSAECETSDSATDNQDV